MTPEAVEEQQPPDIKQVIVIRKDLKMRRGKEIAQGAHAAMAWLTNRLRQSVPEANGEQRITLNEAERTWVSGRFKKVCVQVDSEDELRRVYEEGRRLGALSELITDRGLTEFGGVPTVTCCAIGPAPAELVDRVTGHLRLY
jgi:PTH2 family peptidyl-tRNA hydrolase